MFAIYTKSKYISVVTTLGEIGMLMDMALEEEQVLRLTATNTFTDMLL